MKNKRGQGISMDVIIITIIVVIVLVIVAIFFTGGMASLTAKIKSLFGSQLTDLPEATTRCTNYCTQYEMSPVIQYRDNFCTQTFNVDLNGNGNIGADEKGLTCKKLGMSCPVIESEGAC
ncbi:MAG: hypothetical protein PHD81_02175 [Candidatus Nanoarchaeia archaeon]|nr:hypothetical protein [Candidatus Nanoarchaeia archaeon]MDD5587897.1 hypothetical protein [Candidatus Nanoarchaeia archaeon]